MTKSQIDRFNKVKYVEEEALEENNAKQQSKGFLLTCMKKAKDEIDVLESTIEELIEVNLDSSDSKRKVLVGTL